MTRYEQLMKKATDLLATARKMDSMGNTKMHDIWRKKYVALVEIIGEMSIEEASAIV